MIDFKYYGNIYVLPINCKNIKPKDILKITRPENPERPVFELSFSYGLRRYRKLSLAKYVFCS